MTAIIIDDDNINTTLLTHLLTQYCEDVKILANADSVETGLELITMHHPDILFLDIEIHDKNARDILQLIDTDNTRVILITAFENYAVEMIQYNISGYLLKPIEIIKLVGAVKKARTEVEKRRNKTSDTLPTVQYISVEKRDFSILISIQDIARIEGEGKYTNVYTLDGEKHLAPKSITELEEVLPQEKFMRVHSSHIININCIEKYLKNRNGTIILKDGFEVPISVTYKNVVKERLVI
jgi:two-component system, LytTR family, response regulator